jgi:hypothetical protein
MAYDKPIDKTVKTPEPPRGTLADAHGKGIAGTSSHDLIGNLRGTEGSLTSQGAPQPSGGATGMREQLGSFEAGHGDTDTNMRGEDKRPHLSGLPGEEKLPK